MQKEDKSKRDSTFGIVITALILLLGLETSSTKAKA